MEVESECNMIKKFSGTFADHGVKSRKPHLILHRIIRNNLGVDRNMIPGDLEVNFVHQWKLKVSEI